MKIGIDAGGTKTTGILYKQTQKVDEYTGEMGNPIVDFDLAVSNVMQVIETLLSKNRLVYSDIFSISIGMAGAGTLLPELNAAFKHKIQCRFTVDSDLKMSHIATFKNNDGNLFIAGTGSSLLSRQKGQFVQKGGWGHILGDEGSGYWLGKEILKAYIHYIDFSESMELVPTLKEHFPDRSSIIQTVYSKPKTEVAKLATLYTSFEENQFLHSLAIQAGRDIAKTLLSCNEDTDVAVAFEGSVIQKNAVVFDSFMEEMKSAKKTVQLLPSRPANESVFYL